MPLKGKAFGERGKCIDVCSAGGFGLGMIRVRGGTGRTGKCSVGKMVKIGALE